MPALSAVLLIFTFQFSLLFFHVGSQAAAAAYVVVTQYRISDVAENVESTFLVRTAQGKDFELILTVARWLHWVE